MLKTTNSLNPISFLALSAFILFSSSDAYSRTMNVCSKQSDQDTFLKVIDRANETIEVKVCRFSQSDSHCQSLGTYSKEALNLAQLKDTSINTAIYAAAGTAIVLAQYGVIGMAETLLESGELTEAAITYVGGSATNVAGTTVAIEEGTLLGKFQRQSSALAKVINLASSGRERECNNYDGNISELIRDIKGATEGLETVQASRKVSVASITEMPVRKLNRMPGFSTVKISTEALTLKP